jgi:RNA polymerase sigma factor (sigma-70 family)
MEPEATLLSHLSAVERIAGALAKRHGLSGDDAADFGAEVKARLVADDYAVIRKFQGRSSLTTYLTVVIANFFRDFRNAKWGRWRASADAKRFGVTGIRLEALIYRDGYSLREAVHRVHQTTDGRLPYAELMRIAAALPERARPIRATEEAAHAVASKEFADTDVINRETDEARQVVLRAMENALSELAAEDQVILRMRYLDGFSVADVAKALRIEQKPLYPRINANLARLRRSLENQGVDGARVGYLLAD